MSKISKTFHSDQFVASYSVEKAHDGLRLDQFMLLFLGSLSRQFIKKKISKGEITISRRASPHRASTKVHCGEVVTMVTRPSKGNEPGLDEPEVWDMNGIPIDVEPKLIFEDEKILVINKPPFMVTHPTGRRIFHCATVFYETLYKHTIHSVHRLDRETSGVLVLGKSPQGAQEMTSLFESGLVKKCYLLIAHKNRQNKEYLFPFTARENLSTPSEFDKTSGTRIYVRTYPEGSSQGKVAQTAFELVEEFENHLLLLAYPKTGRQHQIRVHASHHGFPLIGDKLYNGDPSVFIRFKDGVPTEADYEKMQLPRHALHAMAIHFPYGGGNEKTFTSIFPLDFKWWLENYLSLEHQRITGLEEKVKQVALKHFNQ